MPLPTPTPTPTPTLLASIGDVLIGVQPDPLVIPGQQWLYITARPTGQALADFLTPEWRLTPDMQWLVIPHNADVDYRLKKLIDVCAAIRLSAPALIQLTFLPDTDPDLDHDGHPLPPR